jgi:hypothetical protein
MIDAYTIGITLALDDNVSAGIATIREQLLTVDRMIAKTASSLANLQALGQRLGAVGTAALVPAPSPTNSSALSKDAAGEADAPPDPKSAPSTEPSLQASPAGPTAAVRQPQAPPLSPAAPTIAPAPSVTGESTARPPPRLADFAPSAPRPDHLTQAPSATVIVEKRTDGPDKPDRPAGQGQAPPPLLVEPRRSPTRNFHVPETAPPLPAAPVPSTIGDKTRAPSNFAPLMSPTPIPSSPESANGIPRRETRSPVPEDSPAPNIRHQERNQAPVQMSGEIILEGAHVGRWVADMLAEMASRPPNGTTGFDPRIGPSWPGMVGG